MSRRAHRAVVAGGLTCLLWLALGQAMIAEPIKPEGPAAPGATSFEEQHGFHVQGIKLTAADHMLDLRFRVLDPDLTWQVLGAKDSRPVLVHLRTGARLVVPSMAYVGRLAPSRKPLKDRVYFMFFSNPGIVKPGDKVMILIGSVEIGPLTVA